MDSSIFSVTQVLKYAETLDYGYLISKFFADYLAATLVLGLLVSPPVRRIIRRFIYRRLGLKTKWKKLLKDEVPLYHNLPDNLKAKLEKSANYFLREVRFKGKNGFKVTDKEKVTVAGHACVLLLGWRKYAYNGIRKVEIYPSTVKIKQERSMRWFKAKLPKFIAGLWSQGGNILLCWDSVTYGAVLPFDGQNVVYHEFAHELDYLYGFSGGMYQQEPGFMEKIRGWLFKRELKKLRRRQDNEPSVISEYGETNQTELFACATEAFFERPADLKEKHPAIFMKLLKAYRIDPIDWAIR